MHYFNADNLSSKDKKKKLAGTVIPRPIALVMTQSDEVINIAPFSYFNIVSNDPPLLSIAIQRSNGELKDTSRNILAKQEATVHIVDEDIVKEANKTSATLPADESELKVSNFNLVESNIIGTPGIREAAVRYETTLYNAMEIKNSEELIVADLIVLEVVGFHLAGKIYDEETGYIIADKLKPVSRLAGADYAKLGDQFDLIRPD
ncbi:flavin reductase family protein [Aerococcaceae bacterium DSM 111021]|nr:flavin reductase family protein [Aerococcaceae bacterium DSM 111021]